MALQARRRNVLDLAAQIREASEAAAVEDEDPNAESLTMSLDLLQSLLEPHGFRPAHVEEVPAEERARPHFRGARELLVRWEIAKGQADDEGAESPPEDGEEELIMV